MKVSNRHIHLGTLVRLFVLPAMLAAAAAGATPATPARAVAFITVDTTNGGAPAVDSACSLSEAITNANDDGQTYTECLGGSGNDTINFDNSLGTATITLSTSLPTISDSDGLTIDGGGDISIDGADTWTIIGVAAPATFHQLVIQNANNAFSGGLYITAAGNLTVEQSLFYGNHAGGTGGAIDNGGTLTVNRSTFTSNDAGISGGAISNEGTATISNSTFVFNSSAVDGGAIWTNATLTLRNATFSQNSAPAGKGAALHVLAGTATLRNSILANSTTGDDCVIEGGIVYHSFNLVEDSSPACGLTDGVNGDIVGVDPSLGSLSGVPAYFVLNPDSPAIDAADADEVYGTLDEPGNPRVVAIPWIPDTGFDAGSGIPDMGAYEYQIACPGGTQLYVDDTATGTNSGTSWANAFPDLQMALGTMAACGTPTVTWVAQGVYVPDSGMPDDPKASFVIPPGTRVYGGFNGTEISFNQADPDTNVTILSGDIDGDDANGDLNQIDEQVGDQSGTNAYHVVMFDPNSGNIQDGTVLNGFTITGGSATGSGSDSNGGGILCAAGGSVGYCSPTLENLVIIGNQAAYGGGMLNDASGGGESSPAFSNVRFINNSAGSNAGGLFNYGWNGTSSPTLTDVTFEGNYAGSNGGGVFNDGDSGGGSSPILRNVTFTGNSAGDAGGGMYNTASALGDVQPVVVNSTFHDNHASGGGAVFNFASGASTSSSPTFINVTFHLNSVTIDGGAINSVEILSGSLTPVLKNVILWGDTAGSSGQEVNEDGSTSSIDYSIVQGGASGVDGSTAFSDGTGNSTADPVLGPLADNGGLTQTMALLDGSSAINGGDYTTCTTAPVNAVDQRGVLRPQVVACDMGAVERPPAPAAFTDPFRSDVVLYRGGAWLNYDFSSALYTSGVWTGNPGGTCIPAPMDFDGDGNKDFTQLCGGAWHFYNDNGSYNKGIWVGNVAGQLPVPADYNGDGTDDVKLYRGGAWIAYNFASGLYDAANSVWTGNPAGAIPTPMDYDGNGSADPTILAGGAWHFYNANGSYNKGIWVGNVAGQLPVPGDYNGDGIDEVMVFRAGAWLPYDFTSGAFLAGSSVWTGNPAPPAGGGATKPAPIDYDGDGTLDFTFFGGGPWHFYNDNGSYNKGIWVGKNVVDQPISRRPLP